MISDEIGLTIMNECDFDDYVYLSPHNVSESCNDAIANANGVVGEYINDYDVILDVCYPAIVEQELRLRKYVCPSIYPTIQILYGYDIMGLSFFFFFSFLHMIFIHESLITFLFLC